jgi:hypothetical protein
MDGCYYFIFVADQKLMGETEFYYCSAGFGVNPDEYWWLQPGWRGLAADQ